MAMLAGPKRQQKFVLQPRGKPLYEDSNSFGSKMLAKMGWEPGKGLGAKEDGEVNFIKIKYKNDIEGIGYEMRDDQWTQHENQFNKLLKNLSNPNSTTNSTDDEDSCDKVPVQGFKNNEPSSSTKNGISGVSLEEKSKKSKTRVHYKKFTKGKDLTQYSEKDLANIFGKKSFEEQFIPAPEFRLESEEAKEEEKPDPIATSSLQIITSSMSMNDYFQMKMKNIKRPERVMEDTGGMIGGPPDAVEESASHGKKKKKKSKYIERSTEIVVEDSANQSSNVDEELESPTTRKRKRKDEFDIEFDASKKSKKKKKDELVELQVNLEIGAAEKKDKKKKKKNPKETTAVVEEEEIEPVVSDKIKKKKNKRKLVVEDLDVNDREVTNVQTTDVNIHNPLRQAEIEFNQSRNQQIREHLKACHGLVAKSIFTVHPVISEHIRHANFTKFKKSNIGTFIGYGLTSEVELKVLPIKTDIKKLLSETILSYHTNYDFACS